MEESNNPAPLPNSAQPTQQNTTTKSWANIASTKSEPEKKQAKYLVIDTGAFIKGAKLDRIANEFYTVSEVLAEVRDKQARHNLAVFPFEIKVREPHPDSYRAVVEFAKKTGEFNSLSKTDLRILALTHTIEKEVVGSVAHLRTEPLKDIKIKETGVKHNKNRESVPTTRPNRPKSNINNETAAVSKEQQDQTKGSEEKKTEETNVEKENEEKVTTTPIDENKLPEENNAESTSDQQEQKKKKKKKKKKKTPTGSTVTQSHEGNNLAQSQESQTSQTSQPDITPFPQLDDNEGWITPDNIDEVTAKFHGEFVSAENKKVGCITTDYAMQNVLLQMGLNLISIDGMAIRKLKQWVLKCFSCNKITRDMSKIFCPNCGNTTLWKTPVSIDENGNITHYHNQRVKISTRGTKYSIPKPRGGREGNNLIFTEDMWLKANHLLGRRVKDKEVDAFDPDYQFAGDAAHKHEFVVVGYGKKNPNVARKKFGKKNKTKMQM